VKDFVQKNKAAQVENLLERFSLH